MDEDAIGQTIRFIDAMALDRQQSAGGDHPLVQSFWDKVDFILDVEAKAGTKPEVGINRHRDSAKYFAITLNQFDQRVRNLNIPPKQMNELNKAPGRTACRERIGKYVQITLGDKSEKK